MFIFGGRKENIFFVFVAFLSLLYVISAYQPLLGALAFGYDEVHYYKDFTFKLVEDGRWLNHALLPVLKSISNNSWLICYILALWLFFFNVSNDLGAGAAFSSVVASFVITTTPYIHQSLWPATSTLGVLCLLLAQLAVRKGVNRIAIYLLSGIFLFGTLQSYYFLLPLVFIGEFKKETELCFQEKLKLFFMHIFLWGMSSIVGVLFMSTVLFFTVGNFGVKIADWRQAQPIGSLKDVLRNIIYVLGAFKFSLINLFKPIEFLHYYLAVIFLYVCNFKKIKTGFHIVVLLLVVMVSFFVFSIPLSPIIQERSLFAMTASFGFLLIIPGVLPGKNITRIILVLILLFFTYNNCRVGRSYLASDQAFKNQLIEKIVVNSSMPVSNYNGVVLLNKANNTSAEAGYFNSPPIMHGLLYATGFQSFKDCRFDADKFCGELKLSRSVAITPYLDGYLKFGNTDAGWLTIEYTQTSEAAERH